MVDRLVEHIELDLKEGARSDETTYSSNISYLPSGFSSVESALRVLAKLKKDWNIKVLKKSDESYDVQFEKALSIKVKNSYDLDNFMKDLIGAQGVIDPNTFMVDLSAYVIKEAREDVDALYGEISDGLKGLARRGDAKQMQVRIDAFNREFPGGQYMGEQSKDILIKLHDIDKSVDGLVSRMRAVYGDDRGTLEMVADGISSDRPLNAYDVFSEYNSLMGDRVRATLAGVPVTFESVIGMDFIPAERMIFDTNVEASSLAWPNGVHATKNVVYPTGKTFTPRTIRGMAQAIRAIKGKKATESSVVDEEFSPDEYTPRKYVKVKSKVMMSDGSTKTITFFAEEPKKTKNGFVFTEVDKTGNPLFGGKGGSTTQKVVLADEKDVISMQPARISKMTGYIETAPKGAKND